MSGKDTIFRAGNDGDGLARMLAAYGAALERWPGAEGGAEARRRLMADRTFRAAWEAERDLDRALTGLRAELDRGIARDGAVGRVVAGAVGGVVARAPGIRWLSLAAAMVLAAVLGGAFQTLRPPAHAEPGPALLDPTLPEFEEPLPR